MENSTHFANPEVYIDSFRVHFQVLRLVYRSVRYPIPFGISEDDLFSFSRLVGYVGFLETYAGCFS